MKLKSKLSSEKIGLPSTFAQSNNSKLRQTFQEDNFGC